MKGSRKLWVRIAAVIALAATLYMGGRLYIFWRLKETIVSQFELLRSVGIDAHYKSLDVNPWKSSLRITDLKIIFPGKDSACTSSASIPELYVAGISVLAFVLEKELSLQSVFIKQPLLQYGNNLNMYLRSNTRKSPFEELKIGHFNIVSGTLLMIDSTSCVRKVKAELDFTMREFAIDKVGNDSMTWSVAEAKATHMALDLPDDSYKVTVKQIIYSHWRESFKLDSLRLMPTINRIAFAQKTGHQVDQFYGLVPSLEATGFEMGPLYQPSFSARHVTFNFLVDVFRDKRIPRAWATPKVLPVIYLHRLPFKLLIDSVRIASSYVSYEEFPEKGDSTGKIFFNNLQADIHQLSNRSIGNIRMHITSRFMNAGDLQADFTFPQEAKRNYTATGVLSDFSMPSVNGILMAAGDIKIKSGNLHEMKFQFQYNETESEGELSMDYNDLKIQSLRKGGHKTIKTFATWMINALVSNHIDKRDSKDKRTGRIHWKHDPQREIFNYWWKSVQSGLGDVFNLGPSERNKKK